MNTLELKGLDGANPLGFLASMGAFRVAVTSDSGARMGWRVDSASPWPFLVTTLSEDAFADAVCAEARRVAATVASFGDIIKVPAETFRTAARASFSHRGLAGVPSDSDYFAAFASDAVTDDKDGKVTPTQLSFSNGGAGQNLLKDFRMLVSRCVPRDVGEAVISGLRVSQPLTNLNWDPSALRSYAMRWRDPEKEDKVTNVPVQVLAFIGLASFPSFPGERRLSTAGFDARGKVWTWGLWRSDASYAVACSLLRAPYHARSDSGTRRFQSRRLTSNKRYYFAPANPV